MYKRRLNSQREYGEARLNEQDQGRIGGGQSQQLRSFKDRSNKKCYSRDALIDDSDRDNLSMPNVMHDHTNRRSKDKALCPELKSQGLLKNFTEDASDSRSHLSPYG